MKHVNERRKRGPTLLSGNEMQSLKGGRLWPFFNMEDILSGIFLGEDIKLMLIIKG